MKTEILKSALVGTQRYVPDLTEMKQEWAELVKSKFADKEEQFLAQAAFYFSMEVAGQKAKHLKSIKTAEVSEVEKIINKNIESILVQALKEKDNIVLDYLSFIINEHKQVVPAVWIPSVFALAKEEKKKAKDYLKMCGETGRWLQTLNPDYNFQYPVENTQDEDIETVDFDRRLEMLSEKRAINPSQTRDLISNFLKSDPAEKRVQMIEVLQNQLTEDDIPLLTDLLKDKSKKVRDTSYSLLRSLEGNFVNEAFIGRLKLLVKIDEERYLLVVKRKVLKLQTANKPEKLLSDAGLNEVSSEKGVKDELFQFAQILSFVPFNQIAKAFHISTNELFELLTEFENFNFLSSYLSISAEKFNDLNLIRLLFNKTIFAHLIHLLPENEAVKYYQTVLELSLKNKDVSLNLSQILHFHFNSSYQLLNRDFVLKVLEYLTENPYSIQSPDYKKLSFYLSESLESDLDKILEKESSDYATNYLKLQIGEIKRYLEIKKTINKNL